MSRYLVEVVTRETFLVYVEAESVIEAWEKAKARDFELESANQCGDRTITSIRRPRLDDSPTWARGHRLA